MPYYSRTFSALSHRLRCSSPLIITPPQFVLYAHRPTARRYTHCGWGNPSLTNTWTGVGNDPTSSTIKYRVRTSSVLTLAAELFYDPPLDDWHIFFAGSLTNDAHYLACDSMENFVTTNTTISAWPVLTTIYAGASDESSGVEGGMTGDLAWLAILNQLPPMEALDAVLRGGDPLDYVRGQMVHFWKMSDAATETDWIGGQGLAEQLGTFTYNDNYPDPCRWTEDPAFPDASMEAVGAPRRLIRARLSSLDTWLTEVQADLPDTGPAVVRISHDASLTKLAVAVDATAAVEGTVASPNAQSGAVVIGAGLDAGAVTTPTGDRHLLYAAGYSTASISDPNIAASRVAAAATDVLGLKIVSPQAVSISTVNATVIDLSALVDDPGGYGWVYSAVSVVTPSTFGTLSLTEDEDGNITGASLDPAAGLVAGTIATATVTLRSLHPAAPADVVVTLNMTAGGSAYTNGYSAALDIRIGRETLAPMSAAISSGFLLSLPLTHAWLKTTTNGGKVSSASGYDIRIETLSGAVVPYARRAWDGTAGTFAADLKLPVAIGPGTDIDLVMYLGKSGQSDEAQTTAVYSDYAWVLNPDDGTDLTSGDRDLTITGSWATAAGLNGLAADLSGTVYGTYASFGSAMSGLADFSLEAVFKPDAIGTDRGIISIGDDLTSDTSLSYSLRLDARGAASEGALGVATYPNVFKASIAHSGGRQTTESVQNAVTTDWTALIEGLDSANPYLRWKNGRALALSQTFTAINGSTLFSGALNVGRAGLAGSAGSFDGKIQTLRLAARPPSADRAWAMARNVLEASTFFAIGRQRTPADPDRVVTTPMERQAVEVSTTTTYDVLAVAICESADAPLTIYGSPTATAGTVTAPSSPLTGTLQTGSTATVVKLAANAPYTTAQILGRAITIAAQARAITAYDPSTKLATLASALSAAPGAVAYSIAYNVIQLVAPATAQTVTISYAVRDASSQEASGTVTVRVVAAAAAVSTADDFKPWRNRGFGNPVAGVSPGNEFIPTPAASGGDADRKLGYSGQAPATGLLCHIQYQIASSISTDTAVGKSDGTGDWPHEVTWRVGAAPKAGDTVISRPGAIRRRASRVQRLGSNPDNTTDGRRIHRWNFYDAPHGTARDGATTRIRLASGHSTTTDHYVGARIYTWGGAGGGQKSNITGFDASTGWCDVSPAFTTAVASGTTYSLGIEVTADQYWHVLIENKAVSPWTFNTQRASVNTLLWRTDNKWSRVPAGQTPPRKLGPYHGDDRSFEIKQIAGSGLPPDDDRYEPQPWSWGGIVWGYALDGDDYLINEQPYWYNRNTMRDHGLVSSGRRIRQRWKHVLDDNEVQKVWVNCCWDASLTRPNQPLVLTVSQDDGTTYSRSVSCSPHATDIGTTDTGKVSGWNDQLNNDFTQYYNWTLFDFGSTALTFKRGQKYTAKLTTTSSTGAYMVNAAREANSGFQKYDNYVVADGFYALHNNMGWLNALRDRIDPDGAVQAGLPVKAEASTNGDTGPWTGSAMYATDEDFAQFAIYFEHLP